MNHLGDHYLFTNINYYSEHQDIDSSTYATITKPVTTVDFVLKNTLTDTHYMNILTMHLTRLRKMTVTIKTDRF